MAGNPLPGAWGSQQRWRDLGSSQAGPLQGEAHSTLRMYKETQAKGQGVLGFGLGM